MTTIPELNSFSTAALAGLTPEEMSIRQQLRAAAALRQQRAERAAQTAQTMLSAASAPVSAALRRDGATPNIHTLFDAPPIPQQEREAQAAPSVPVPAPWGTGQRLGARAARSTSSTATESASAPPQHSSLPSDAVERIRIRTELSRLGESFAQCSLDDAMTTTLRDWHDRFAAALRLHADARTVQNLFVAQLQRILIDPLRRTLLDERAVLGSDSRTYGYTSLSRFLRTAPAPYNHRSPLEPDNEAIFTTETHEAVVVAVRWLKDLGLFPQEDDGMEVESAPLPTVQSERRRLIIERGEELDREGAQEVSAFVQTLCNRSRAISQFAGQRTNSVRGRVREVAQERFAQLDEMEVNERQMFEAVGAEIRCLNEEANALQAQVDRDSQYLHRLDPAITEGEKENARLRILINQTEIEIKKRNSGWGMALLKGVGVFAGCMVATWLMAAALAAGAGAGVVAGGTKAAILPLNGGAFFRFSFSL